jgi:hypothetical protein
VRGFHGTVTYTCNGVHQVPDVSTGVSGLPNWRRGQTFLLTRQ